MHTNLIPHFENDGRNSTVKLKPINRGINPNKHEEKSPTKTTHTEDDADWAEAGVELYIDRGKGADEDNKNIFDTLHNSKKDIEDKFGGPLDWERLDNKRASRIRKSLTIGGWKDEEKWPAVSAAMAEAMIKLEKALKPYVQSLSVETL